MSEYLIFFVVLRRGCVEIYSLDIQICPVIFFLVTFYDVSGLLSWWLYLHHSDVSLVLCDMSGYYDKSPSTDYLFDVVPPYIHAVLWDPLTSGRCVPWLSSLMSGLPLPTGVCYYIVRIYTTVHADFNFVNHNFKILTMLVVMQRGSPTTSMIRWLVDGWCSCTMFSTWAGVYVQVGWVSLLALAHLPQSGRRRRAL